MKNFFSKLGTFFGNPKTRHALEVLAIAGVAIFVKNPESTKVADAVLTGLNSAAAQKGVIQK